MCGEGKEIDHSTLRKAWVPERQKDTSVASSSLFFTVMHGT